MPNIFSEGSSPIYRTSKHILQKRDVFLYALFLYFFHSTKKAPPCKTKMLYTAEPFFSLFYSSFSSLVPSGLSDAISHSSASVSLYEYPSGATGAQAIAALIS